MQTELTVDIKSGLICIISHFGLIPNWQTEAVNKLEIDGSVRQVQQSWKSKPSQGIPRAHFSINLFMYRIQYTC